MKRVSWTKIFRGSANDILDSLDVRSPRQIPVLRRGQTVEKAWANTGTYLRGAISRYEQTAANRTR